MSDQISDRSSTTLRSYIIAQRRDYASNNAFSMRASRGAHPRITSTLTSSSAASAPSSTSEDTMTGSLEKLSLNPEDAELPPLAFPNASITASASLMQARTDPFYVHALAIGLQLSPYEAVKGYLES